jgi:hypothetical protein
MAPLTDRAKRNWRLWGSSGALWLLALTFIVWASSQAQPPGVGVPPMPGPEDFPELTTSPDGVYNRTRTQMLTHMEQAREIQLRIDGLSAQLDEHRRSPRGGGMQSLASARETLAELHHTVDEMLIHMQQGHESLRSQVVPSIPTMRDEVEREIAHLDAQGEGESPTTERLRQIHEHLARWGDDPEAVLRLFEDLPMMTGDRPWRDRSHRGDDEESGIDAPQILRRLNRLESQQRRLERFVDQLGSEIERLRTVTEDLSPEEIEWLEQSMTPSPPWSGRGTRRGPEEAPEPPSPPAVTPRVR